MQPKAFDECGAIEIIVTKFVSIQAEVEQIG